MPEGSRVDLPPYVRAPFEVYVNGVPQVEGEDYVVRPGAVVFGRSLAREGKLGFMTWLAMWLGIAGSYRKHETVDIAYRVDGEARVAAELPVVTDEGAV